MKGDELLACIKACLAPIKENQFTDMFGKRNGSRERLLKHVRGGSYTLSQLSATLDMVQKTNKEKKIIVFESGCAPSMRLKNDNKDAFHNFRLCFYLDDDGKIEDLAPSPMTKCGCPNGCIVCSHLGGQIAMLHCLVMYCSNHLETTGTEISFESLSARFPQPVHRVLENPITVKSIYPPANDKDKKAQKQWKKMSKTETSASSIAPSVSSIQEPECIDGNGDPVRPNEHNELEEYAGEIAIEGIPDTSTTPTVPVIERLNAWVKALEDGRDCTGKEVKTVEMILEKTARVAKVRNSDLWKGTQILRMQRLKGAIARQSDRNADFNRTNTNKKLIRKDSQMGKVIECIMPNMQKEFDRIGKDCKDFDLKALVEDEIE